MDDENVFVVENVGDLVIGNNDYEMHLDDDTQELNVSFESCFLLNNAYHETLNEFADFLRAKLRENESRLKELEANENNDYSKQSSQSMSAATHTHPNSLTPFMAPYFKDVKSLSQPKNEDTIAKQRNGEINEAYLSGNKPWNQLERDKLTELVQMHAMECQQKPYRDEKETLTRNKTCLTYEIESKIEELTKQIDKIGCRELSAFTAPNRGEKSLDWLKINTLLDSNHDSYECEIYWNNYLHPTIGKHEWSKEEDKKLEEIVNRLGTHDWEKVAETLNTGRIAWQCCARYQSEMNRELKRVGPLTKAEAEKVESIIDSCRVGDYIPWHQISYFIDGRTLPQIKHYWNKVNVPKRGEPWTDDENTVLFAAVKKYGVKNWKSVALSIPGRSNRQCRERYMMRLNITDRKLGNWTKAEDQRILKLAKEHNYKWIKLEEFIKGRNARQIAGRYDMLSRHQTGDKKTKANKWQECTTRTLNVKSRLYERIRSIINRNEDSEDLNEILRNGRIKLAKQLELKKKGFNVQIKGRPKKSVNEGNIDAKICDIFSLYDKIPATKKAIEVTFQDRIVYETTKKNVKELLTGKKAKLNSELSDVIRDTISQHIAPSPSTNIRSDHYIPPLFPPNRATVKAFQGALMQIDYLSQKIAQSNIDLENIPNSIFKNEDYYLLLNRFKSLFCWPALLSSTLVSPTKENAKESVSHKPENSNEPKAKTGRKSWLTTDSTRLVHIREKQTQLIQTAMQERDDAIDEKIDEPIIDVKSTKSPWYVIERKRKYYSLKSLDKTSFVFTRIKPRKTDLTNISESEEESKCRNKRKRRSINGDVSDISCNGTVVTSRTRFGASNDENHETEVDSNAQKSDIKRKRQTKSTDDVKVKPNDTKVKKSDDVPVKRGRGRPPKRKIKN